MAAGKLNAPWRIYAVLVLAVLLLSSLTSASLAAPDKASVASLGAAQIEEELQVRRAYLICYMIFF
jgi:hypothetical protein